MDSEPKDIIGEYTPQDIPKTLYVLTILTFIGCGFSLYFLIDSFYSAVVAHEKYASITSTDSGSLSHSVKEHIDKIEFLYNTRYVLLFAGILSITLCLIGAIMMRKLQKRGLYFYLSGELGFPILAFILYGFIWTGLLDFVDYLVPFVFAALYFTQRSHLRR